MYRKSLMGSMPLVLTLHVGTLVFLAAAVGCQPNAVRKTDTELQAVPVSYPVQRDVTDHVDFTGRTDSVFSVDIRARVSGYLMHRYFKDGSDVKAGDLLFEIDPRPYQAQLNQALSQVELNKASLKLARTTYERDKEVAKAQIGGVSQQQLDEDWAAVEEAAARVRAAESSTEVYKLNLGFTKITAPINGLISRTYMTEGNLVIQDQTLLTTIVSLDPMYVYFDLDEPTFNRINNATNEGKLKRLRDGSMPVVMGLQGEKDHPHKGAINFVNNQLNPTTGSITMRGVFENPKPPNGERLLLPGMFVRIRLPISRPYPALLVIDRAIGSDQGLKYVYVLDANNKVQYRRVATGSLQPDGLRVITEGLKPDDWVVVGGLPQIRPRMEVRPDRTTMPVLVSPSAQNTAPLPDPSEKKPEIRKPKSEGKTKTKKEKQK